MNSNQSTAKERLIEEQLYKQISDEKKNGYRRDGLWLKAISESNNDENKAEALYVKLRFQSILDEEDVRIEQERIEAEAKAEQKRIKHAAQKKKENLEFEARLEKERSEIEALVKKENLEFEALVEEERLEIEALVEKERPERERLDREQLKQKTLKKKIVITFFLTVIIPLIIMALFEN